MAKKTRYLYSTFEVHQWAKETFQQQTLWRIKDGMNYSGRWELVKKLRKAVCEKNACANS